ncbi:MAG: phosphate signaling complex protein PhoU [Opitutales bacterium]|nr:phosphate signaling complex protein PhoU [Opitutales bacterium]
MARFFQSELDELRTKIVQMAELAAVSVENVLRSLYDRDADAARRVREDDDVLDKLEVEIDAAANRYISLRAPVAGDMRLVTVALKASHELERIGDEASSIAKRVLRLCRQEADVDLGGIRRIGEPALALIRESIDCLVQGDSARASAIPRGDKEVDEIHRANYADYIARIGAEPAKAPAYIELIFISKSIERIGDHATNIAVETIYLVEGEDIRHTDRTKRSMQ